VLIVQCTVKYVSKKTYNKQQGKFAINIQPVSYVNTHNYKDKTLVIVYMC